MEKKVCEREAGTSFRSIRSRFWVGCTQIAVFSAQLFWWASRPAQGIDWLFTLLLAIPIIAGVGDVLGALHVRVTLHDDHFVYQTFLRKRHTIRYHSLERMQVCGKKLSFFVDEKKYQMDTTSISGAAELREIILGHAERNKAEG